MILGTSGPAPRPTAAVRMERAGSRAWRAGVPPCGPGAGHADAHGRGLQQRPRRSALRALNHAKSKMVERHECFISGVAGGRADRRRPAAARAAPADDPSDGLGSWLCPRPGACQVRRVSRVRPRRLRDRRPQSADLASSTAASASTRGVGDLPRPLHGNRGRQKPILRARHLPRRCCLREDQGTGVSPRRRTPA